MSDVVLPLVSIATLKAGTVDPEYFNHEAHVSTD